MDQDVNLQLHSSMSKSLWIVKNIINNYTRTRNCCCLFSPATFNSMNGKHSHRAVNDFIKLYQIQLFHEWFVQMFFSSLRVCPAASFLFAFELNCVVVVTNNLWILVYCSNYASDACVCELGKFFVAHFWTIDEPVIFPPRNANMFKQIEKRAHIK